MLQPQYQKMINQVIQVVQKDKRFSGVAIGGSYVTRDMDEFSDLDFVLVVKDEYYQEITKNRFAIVEKFGDLLTAFTGEHVNEPRVLICLYDAPMLHVDCKFVSVEDLPNRVENPVILYQENNALRDALAKKEAMYPIPELQWMEDRFWVWVHYAATKIGRNELFEVIDFLSFIRQTVISPLILMKHGKLPRGVRKIEVDAPDYIEALKKTVAVHEVNSCISAVKTTIDLYMELREYHAKKDFCRHGKAEKKSLDYFEQIQSNIRRKNRMHDKSR